MDKVMTDKERVIIDGVDVSKCEYLKEAFTGLICADCNKSNDCSKSPNCYFKQLVRKTQECENLKEDYKELEQRHDEAFKDFERLKQECEELKEKYKWYDHYKDSALLNKKLCDKASDERARYRKALEEIESYVKSQLDGFGNDVYGMDKAAINYILDIINKAKGEE